ncbi:hypothetical protein Lal_00012725 [Lupinus albus]|nr:hypothetical protein Lal_00012725 [Lupinus albus]
MPPKNSQKEPYEPLTQILMDKLKENQEQQDARHAAITTVLQSITEKLADISSPTQNNQGSPQSPGVNPNLEDKVSLEEIGNKEVRLNGAIKVRKKYKLAS